VLVQKADQAIVLRPVIGAALGFGNRPFELDAGQVDAQIVEGLHELHSPPVQVSAVVVAVLAEDGLDRVTQRREARILGRRFVRRGHLATGQQREA